MVFDETLRLYPPLLTFSRVAVADDSFCGLRLTAGTNVMLNMFAVHRRPALWDNPEGFDPTRFDPQRKNGKRRSEEHTSELQSLMRISYAVFCLKKKKYNSTTYRTHSTNNTYTITISSSIIQ